MQNSNSTKTTENLNKIIKIDEAQIRNHLGEMVRSTVEETLNDMLDAEADQLCGASRYERTEARVDCRAGHYKRKLHTKAGEVELKMPKLPSNCPQNGSRDSKKPWENSKSTRTSKLLSSRELTCKHKFCSILQKEGRSNPALSVRKLVCYTLSFPES